MSKILWVKSVQRVLLGPHREVILKNTQNIKFYGIMSIWNRAVPCGQTDGQADMSKLVATFRIFEKALSEQNSLGQIWTTCTVRSTYSGDFEDYCTLTRDVV